MSWTSTQFLCEFIQTTAATAWWPLSVNIWLFTRTLATEIRYSLVRHWWRANVACTIFTHGEHAITDDITDYFTIKKLSISVFSYIEIASGTSGFKHFSNKAEIVLRQNSLLLHNAIIWERHCRWVARALTAAAEGPGLKTALFNNFLCSPSSKWVPDAGKGSRGRWRGWESTSVINALQDAS